MLFERRLQAGLKDGTISLAFRRWRRPQAVGGRTYRSPVGMVRVEHVSVVDRDIPLEDARAAGYPSVEALLGDLSAESDGYAIYRLELHRDEAPDPRSVLAEAATLNSAELTNLQRSLARLDRERDWTMATLRAIEQHPGRRAGDLAPMLGWPELLEFKLQVRKLKALGLTVSLRVGYRLSPRGHAYLEAVDAKH